MALQDGSTLILAANPSTLDYGTAAVGTVIAMTLTLRNTSQQGSITGIGATVDNPAFTLGTVPTTLSFGASRGVQVTFSAPATPGSVTGNITINSDADNTPVIVPLTANVVTSTTPAISISPSSWLFPDTRAGKTSPPQTFVITNTGGVSVTVHVPTVLSPFTAIGFPTGDTVLTPGQTLSIQVAFSPLGGGFVTVANGLTVTSTAPSSPDTVALSGNGVPITPYGYVIGGLENGFATIGNLMRIFDSGNFASEEVTSFTKVFSYYGPTVEARQMRMEIQYEDWGPAIVTVEVANEHGEVSQQNISIGSTGPENTIYHLVKNQLADLVISGELIRMMVIPVGPLVMVAYVPLYNEAGDVKKVGP